MATPENWDQFNEDMRRWQALAEDMALKYQGLVNVADSGQLAALAFIANLSSAPVGDLSVLQTKLQVQNVAGRPLIGSGGDIMTSGAYGWGTQGGELGSATSDQSQDTSKLRLNGCWRLGGSATSTFPGQASGDSLLHLGWSSGYWSQLGIRLNPAYLYYRGCRANSVDDWQMVYSTKNTTRDSNGFLKSASPIFRLSNTAEAALVDGLNFLDAGAGAANDEAIGVTASHDDLGVYTVHGSLGFATEGWTIEVPQDANGNRLCFVETAQADDGTITVRTFSRKFDFEAVAIVAGDPMDIPEGRWIDLRLSMPEPEQPDDPEPEKTDPTTAA